MRIYTRAYLPFRMGGNLRPFVAAEVTEGLGEPTDVGQGLLCRLVACPDGTTLVAETTTGAIVGDTLEDVLADMASADPETVRKQMAQAALDSAAAEPISAARLWELMRRLAPGKETT